MMNEKNIAGAGARQRGSLRDRREQSQIERSATLRMSIPESPSGKILAYINI